MVDLRENQTKNQLSNTNTIHVRTTIVGANDIYAFRIISFFIVKRFLTII